MGLDQYIYIKYPSLKRGDNQGEQVAYWRKDWPLQEYINSDNSEIVELTPDFCESVLTNLVSIYDETHYYSAYTNSNYTKQAFEKCLQLLSEGKDLYYEADW